jgi:hypothetical protein
MSDEDKRAEYDRKPGIKKTYVHERAYERGLSNAAYKRLRKGKRTVTRNGDIPKGGEIPAYRTITVTNAQHKAYTLISNWCKKMPTIKVSTLRQVNIREATIKALESKQLITITDGIIRLYKRSPTQEELNNEHGVGKLVIKIGI